MKTFNKMLSLLLSAIMVLAMSVTAMASGAYSITINNSTTGHTYEAYQIFTGTLTDKTLTNIDWGTGVTVAGQTALQAAYGVSSAEELAEKLTTEAEAEAFAEAVAEYLEAVAGTTSGSNYTISGLAAGYYLVKDADGTVPDGDAYTSYILKVTNDVSVDAKSDAPSVEKKVKDTNDTTGDTSSWQDSADYDIGDTVSFQLTATLPDNVSDYNKYSIIFNDTLSAGLTFSTITSITVNGQTVNNPSSYATTVSNSDGTTSLAVAIGDVIALGAANGSTVVVEYTAVLNENAEIGATGNPNTVSLTYSNNPNVDYSGDFDDTDNDGNPDTPTDEDGNDTDSGETPEDKVIVFTYELVVNKVDSDKKALAGAGFTLYKFDYSKGDYVEVKSFTAGTDTTFTFTGLDDGQYKLVETTTPSGYNTVDDIVFTVSAEHEETSDTPALISLTTDNSSVTGDASTGVLTTDVVNYSGAQLPETGGMGTRVIYLMGGALVVIAGVLLVAKKRMQNN